jgi:hypothetical protein
MAGKQHNDRVTQIVGGRDADEAPQIFKIGQVGSAQSGRRDFLKSSLVAAASISTASLVGCGNKSSSSFSSRRETECARR